MKKQPKKIMALRLGGLGDLVARFNHFAYIRKLHPDAHITLMTPPLYVEFMRHCPYFDNIITDNAPKSSDIIAMAKVNRKIAAGKYDAIYNFQHKGRRGFRYLFLVGSKIINELNVPRDFSTNKNWLRKTDISKFQLPESYVVIVPGCTIKQPEKRWVAENYGKLCVEITKRGFTPVIVGTKLEKEAAQEILRHCSTAIDLLDKTNILELIRIVDNAKCVIGNDTGAIHMGHYMETKTIALVSRLSQFSDSFLQNYYGDPHFSTIIADDLQNLSVAEVIEQLTF